MAAEMSPADGGTPQPSPLRLGSLCTGYGGLDLALEHLTGASPLWLAEFDKHASKVCAARFPDVPNLHDLSVLDWRDVPAIDVLTAGYPCQPFSHAGRRKGTHDHRHLWPYIADALRVLRPGLVVLENVSGHLSLGFDVVLGDLASLGFHAEWVVLGACDVGACHRRNRLWIVAADASRPGAWWNTGGAPRAEEPHRRGEAHEGDAPIAVREAVAVPYDFGCEGAVAIAQWYDGRGDSRSGWGEYEPAIRRHELVLGRPAPAPVVGGGHDLSPLFVEWMMMLPEGWVTDVPKLSRNQALKILGNGVVPPQAAHAVNHLLGRHEAEAVAA